MEEKAVGLFVAAVLTSCLSGVTGMGGGITLLGVMTIAMPPPAVVPVHGVVQLFSNLSRTVVFFPNVRWRVFAFFAVPFLVGIVSATQVWRGDQMVWFRAAMGVFLFLFLATRHLKLGFRSPPFWTYSILGLVTGFLTIFVGATGPFLAPFFLRADFEKEEIIATKAVCQAFGHCAKVPAFLALGFDFLAYGSLTVTLVIGVVAGTLIGRSILYRLKRETFIRVFEVTLAGLAAYLCVTGFGSWGSPP